MRAALLCLFLCIDLVLAAQQNPDNQPQNESTAIENQAQPVAPGTPADWPQVRPLQQRDIDVLTGKSSTSVPASARAVSGAYAGGAYGGYYPYSANVPLFTGGQFNSTRDSDNQRFFRNFGQFNPRGFLFFGSRGFGTLGGPRFPGRFGTQQSTGTTAGR